MCIACLRKGQFANSIGVFRKFYIDTTSKKKELRKTAVNVIIHTNIPGRIYDHV